MLADPLRRFALDANILSIARSLRLSLAALVGCLSDQLAIPLSAIDECLITTSPTHPRRAEYLQLITGLPILDTAASSVVTRATAMVDRYARHGASYADMLIAAASLEHSCTLVSANWSALLQRVGRCRCASPADEALSPTAVVLMGATGATPA